MTQLDLFRDFSPPTSRPSAALTPFPLARRRQFVVKTSNALFACRGNKARQRLWDKTICDLRQQLDLLDASQAEINSQLLAFHRAVSTEMACQCNVDDRQQPGGAA